MLQSCVAGFRRQATRDELTATVEAFMRVVQPAGQRGSLKWLQAAVNHCPEVLHVGEIGAVRWVSPLARDDFAEYRDAAFLEMLGLSRLAGALADFWPRRGPQWDALGLTADGVVLVEAKAHLGEFLSPPSAASAESRRRIDRAFAAVRDELGVTTGGDWTTTYYQFCNRLAHHHFLLRHGVRSHLLMVGFVGDAEMNGPATAAEWLAAIGEAERATGLDRATRRPAHVHHVFPHVDNVRVRGDVSFPGRRDT